MAKDLKISIRCSWCKQLFSIQYQRYWNRLKISRDITCSQACAGKKYSYEEDIRKYGKRPLKTSIKAIEVQTTINSKQRALVAKVRKANRGRK